MPDVFAGFNDVTLIGEGGLGRVYRAVRTSTGGVVAIKELRDVGEGRPPRTGPGGSSKRCSGSRDIRTW